MGDWISTDDRLPEESGGYLIFVGINYITVGLFAVHTQSWHDFIDGTHRPTHWMELPDWPEDNG